MTAASLITLRETLETSLVVGIILAFVGRTDERRRTQVWAGVACGIALSVMAAALSQYVLLHALAGRAGQLYEGTLMIVASLLLSSMILWMLKRRRTIRSDIEQRLSVHLDRGETSGIFLLSFVSTAREGVETVVFLQAAILQARSGLHAPLLGALVGIGAALSISWLVFRGVRSLPLQQFFAVTSTLLILLAAGLLAHGIGAFEEMGLLPAPIAPVWNLHSLLPESSPLGSLLHSTFGYTDAPSLLQVLCYVSYLILVTGVMRRRQQRE